jgi:hypothetical protein
MKFPAFYETRRFITVSQQPAASPYPMNPVYIFLSNPFKSNIKLPPSTYA